MIEIQNLSKTFYRKKTAFKALDNVSLNVAEGEIVGIIGFSGAGKSTLIRSVNLLEKPDQGRILIKGSNLLDLNPKQLAAQRKKIGMIFQHFNLMASRTVFDNIALPLELDKMPKTLIEQKVRDLMQIVGLEDKALEYPARLSGGQKQRVAIARALANDPNVLLCDEATSALDPATTQSILTLLKDINKRLNLTILLITHEMEVVKTVCDRVAVIDQGKLLVQGSVRDVMADTQNPIVRQFLNEADLSLPNTLNRKLKSVAQDNNSPVVEVLLEGQFSFEGFLRALEFEAKIPYLLLKVAVENLDGAGFGKLLLHLQGDAVQNHRTFVYLHQHQIQHTIKGHA